MRIGIALEACDVPAWQATAVHSIRRLNNADIVLFVIVDRGTPSHTQVASQAVKLFNGNRTRMAFNALATVSLRDIVGTTHSLALSPSNAGGMDHASSEIRARNLDALVTFASPDNFGNCGALARLGLWFLDTGSGPLSPSNGSLVGLKECLHSKPFMITELRVRQPDNSGTSWLTQPARPCIAARMMSRETSFSGNAARSLPVRSNNAVCWDLMST